MGRRIVVCCGGRNLRLPREIGRPSKDAKSHQLLMLDGLEKLAPTHLLHGAQRGGDTLWDKAARVASIDAQIIRVDPSPQLLKTEKGSAYADRTRLLWEIARGLIRKPDTCRVQMKDMDDQIVACCALPGGPGTTLCCDLAKQHEVEVILFDWEWIA